MTTPMGSVAIDGERRSVRFERRYDASPDELWGALTLPDQLRRWLAPADFEPRVGGRIVLRFEDDDVVHGEVTRYEPPRVLEYTWEEQEQSLVRFELRPEGPHTVLVLEHRRLPPAEVVAFGAGWHAHLDGLELALEGREHDWRAAYRTLRPLYEARLP